MRISGVESIDEMLWYAKGGSSNKQNTEKMLETVNFKRMLFFLRDDKRQATEDEGGQEMDSGDRFRSNKCCPLACLRVLSPNKSFLNIEPRATDECFVFVSQHEHSSTPRDQLI